MGKRSLYSRESGGGFVGEIDNERSELDVVVGKWPLYEYDKCV